MVCRLLRRRCVYIEEADDGVSAVQKVRDCLAAPFADTLFDVVLIDYEMPELNGPEAVCQMRELQYTGLVIGLTGHVGSQDVAVFMDHGADHVLSKPFDAKQFDVLIRRHFD